MSHVAATSCETDDCGVVLLLFGALALVVGSRVRIAMPSNPGSTEQGVLELLVARAGGVLYADLLAGSAGDEGRCRRRRPGEPQPKRLGKLLIKPLSPAESAPACVADGQIYPRASPESEPGPRCRDRRHWGTHGICLAAFGLKCLIGSSRRRMHPRGEAKHRRQAHPPPTSAARAHPAGRRC